MSLQVAECSLVLWPLHISHPVQLLSHLLAVTATVRKPRAEGNEQLGAAWRCLALLGARLIRPRPTQQICKATRQKVKASNIIKQFKLPVMFLTDSNVSNSFEAMATFSWPHCARKSVRLRRGYSLN